MVYERIVSGSIMILSGTSLEVAGAIGYHEHVPQSKVINIFGIPGTTNGVMAYVHLGRRVTKADYA